MKRIALILLTALFLTGCGAKQPEPVVKEEPAAVEEAHVEAEEATVEEEDTDVPEEAPNIIKEETFDYEHIKVALSVEEDGSGKSAYIILSTNDKYLGALVYTTNYLKVLELREINGSMALICDGAAITTLGTSMDEDGNSVKDTDWLEEAIKTESSLTEDEIKEITAQSKADIDEFFAEFQ